MRFVLTLLTLSLFGCQTSPEVKKTSEPPSALLSLERTSCYGACPVYLVEVFADGLVRFKGSRHVMVTEPVELQLEPTAFQKLTARLEQSPFAQWRDFLKVSSSDAPTVVLTYKGHVVRHYRGDDAAPPELTALEDDVDALIGTQRWIKGTGVETQ